jgi:hypothetical protein
VIEEYRGRRMDFPEGWIHRVKVEEVTSYWWSGRAS